ncbi:hypothetical protein BSKO_06594 [Bryopsis sp. KO-2023]|nr:hypothetical protein BSKO_06594 [Bryopsis sp. KO-2023]
MSRHLASINARQGPTVRSSGGSGRAIEPKSLGTGARRRDVCVRAQAPVEVGETSEQRGGDGNPPSCSGIGYSFTPGGMLVPYYVGVMKAMTELGLIGPDTPVSGSSAGAIAAAFMASGIDMKDCLEANKRLQLDVLRNGTFQKLCNPLRDTLMDMLPEDIHHRANGRVGLAVTIYRPLTHDRPMEGRILDHFSDKEDFVEGIVGSCYIPYYVGPKAGIEYRGEIYSDGLPTNFFPPVVESAREGLEKTITVCAIPRANRFYRDGPGVDISPDNRPKSERFSSWGYVQRAMLAYPLDEVVQIANDGYDEASRWGEKFLTDRIRESSETGLSS